MMLSNEISKNLQELQANPSVIHQQIKSCLIVQ